MANSYTLVAPEHGLPCTAEEAETIKELLFQDDDNNHGFEFTREGNLGYLIAEESGTWDELPPDALALIGTLIERQGWPHLEFGVAFTCSKMRAGEFGGTAFRIMANGSIVNRVEGWPDQYPFTLTQKQED